MPAADRCELGPVMVVYPDAVWYSVQSRADVDEIIESHLKGGRPVTRLRLAHDQTELRPEQRAPADRAAPTPTDSDAESPA